MAKPIEQLQDVIIRFAGDSGDGMQLTGGRFTSETALFGNDLSTLPDFPAEIRAPAGSLPGVSGFQIHYADHDILTPGDAPHVLVAMNPAALRTNLKDLPAARTLIVNSDAFSDRNLQKAGYTANPLEDGSLDEYRVHEVPLTSLTLEAVKGTGLTNREAERSKNMFALGLMSWLYTRPTEGTIEFIAKKFAKRPEIAEANTRAFNAGYAFGETSEGFAVHYEVAPAPLPPGTYRNITGNQALALGLVAASVQSKLPLFLSAYPITPASDILHDLARNKNFGVRTFQAEDEIAAVGRRSGRELRRRAGRLHLERAGRDPQAGDDRARCHARAPARSSSTSSARGPRPGCRRSRSRPTCSRSCSGGTRRRRCRSSPPRLRAAASTRRSRRARIALKYRTPVFVLSDAYLANGSEPWLLPDVDTLPDISIEFADQPNVDGSFMPYRRDPETLARDWAIPGTPGLEHRIGGLEKEDVTGNVSYDPDNHDHMVRLRAQKVAGIAADIPELEVDDPDGASLLVLGWGGTYGPIQSAARRLRRDGKKVAHAHLTHLNPFPRNLGEVLRSYDRVLVPEMNLGQLLKLVRAEFLVDAVGFNRVRGLPFRSDELADAMEAML